MSLFRVYVLGDTSYGECCVDEVAAEHIGADSVIHFGNACLTPTQRLPVLYIFTDLPLNLAKFQATLAEKVAGENIAVVYDLQYHRVLSQLDPSNLRLCPPSSSNEGTNEGVIIESGRQWPSNIRDGSWKIVYVGSNVRFEMVVSMTFPQCSVISYDVARDSLVTDGVNVKKALMKRYMLIEKTKDAERIGILVGTLGASRYGCVIDQLRATIKAAGRKAYTFLVGKPNVPKLANFPEIDIFVLVACPENSLMDSKEFLKPIITPFELEVALNANRNWTGDYLADFSDILPGADKYVEFRQDDANDLSLITGKIRINDVKVENPEESSKALALQDTRITTLHQMGGGQYLAERSWQGLEQKIGETAPSLAVEGQTGIAWSYTNKGQ